MFYSEEARRFHYEGDSKSDGDGSTQCDNSKHTLLTNQDQMLTFYQKGCGMTPCETTQATRNSLKTSEDRTVKDAADTERITTNVLGLDYSSSSEDDT